MFRVTSLLSLFCCAIIGISTGCDTTKPTTVAAPASSEALKQVAATLRSVIDSKGKPDANRLNVAMESVDAAATNYPTEEIKTLQSKAKTLQEALNSKNADTAKTAADDLTKYLNQVVPPA